MDVTYANTTGVPPSLSGSKYYVADEVHFSSQDCNVTADTLLNVCCKVKFKEGFDFDGDICDLDGDAIFQGFTAKRNTGFGFCDELAQCGALGNPCKALIGLGSSSGHISTQLQATSSTGCASASGSVTVLNPCADAETAQGNSIKIAGGTGVNKNVSITTTEGNINLVSSGDVLLQSTTDMNLVVGPGGDGSTIGDYTNKFSNVATDTVNTFIVGGEGLNVFSQRFNFAHTVGGVKAFPSRTATGPIPLSTTDGGFPGDKLGDLMIGSDKRVYLCITSYESTSNKGSWMRLTTDGSGDVGFATY